MSANKYAVDLDKQFEGFEPHPYLCPAGIPTIGFGSTRYEDGTRVKMSDPPISREEAERLLSLVQLSFDVRIRTRLGCMTKTRAGALGSFAYNLGCGALFGSTLAKKVRAGSHGEAAKQFGRWIYGGGRKLSGLIRRREAERRIYEL